MKKRIFSLVLAFLMVSTSLVQVAFAGAGTNVNGSQFDYFGIGPFAKAEDALDKLNADVARPEAVLNLRDSQQSVLQTAKTAFYAKTYAEVSGTAWDNYFDKIVDTHDGTPYATQMEQYLSMRFIEVRNPKVGNGPEVINPGDEVPVVVAKKLRGYDTTYNTSGLTLEQSNALFGTYADAISELYQANSSAIEAYISSNSADYLAFKKEALFDSTKLMLGLVFSTTGEGADNSAFDYSFKEDFNKNDVGKKNLALFFGKKLTKDLADTTFVNTVKNYIKTNPQGISDLNTSAQNIFVQNKANAIDAVYDTMGKVVSGAYAGKDAENEAKMLFGDGTNKGALEMAFDIFDNDSSLENIWLNLFLREYVQLSTVTTQFTTIDADNISPAPMTIFNNMPVSFVIDGLDEYGVSSENLTLRSNYFNIEITGGPAGSEGKVSYDTTNGCFNVTVDGSLPDYYDAVATLYRSNGTGFGVDTYIESYPITVKNTNPSNNRPSSGSDVVYIEKDKDENGTIYGPGVANKGDEVEYTFVPEDGFIIDKIIVNGNVVDFERDGVEGKIVIKADKNIKIEATYIRIVDSSNHYAYIIGDDLGNFNPRKNITRGEAAAIFFRLLTEEARDRFYTKVTNYSDVDSTLWSASAIGTLANAGILTGYPDGTFKPEGKITRAEFATIVKKFYSIVNDTKAEFTDISGHWAEKSIDAIASKNWINGYEDNTYRPDNYIVRSEAVAIVNRMLGRSVRVENILKGAVTYPDCDVNEWYYADVIEASNSHNFDSVRLEDGTEKWTQLKANIDWTIYQ